MQSSLPASTAIMAPPNPHLRDHPDRLKEVDEHITSLRSMLAFMEDERRRLTSIPSSAHPIGVPEVLGHIMEWGVHLEAFTPELLLLVSRHWQTVALSTPGIWARIVRKPTYMDSYSQFLTRCQRYLDRSKSHPLYIDVDFLYFYFEAPTNTVYTQFAELIQPHLHRCYHISLANPRESLVHLFSSLSPDHIEHIAHYCANSTHRGPPLSLPPLLPNLRHLSGTFPLPVFATIDMPALEHLQIALSPVNPSFHDLLSILQRCSNLKCLLFDNVTFTLAVEPDLTSIMVHLPLLNRLEFHCSGSADATLLTHHVTMPQLRELCITGNILPIPLGLFSNITSLQCGDWDFPWFVRALRVARNLERLTVRAHGVDSPFHTELLPALSTPTTSSSSSSASLAGGGLSSPSPSPLSPTSNYLVPRLKTVHLIALSYTNSDFPIDAFLGFLRRRASSPTTATIERLVLEEVTHVSDFHIEQLKTAVEHLEIVKAPLPGAAALGGAAGALGGMNLGGLATAMGGGGGAGAGAAGGGGAGGAWALDAQRLPASFPLFPVPLGGAGGGPRPDSPNAAMHPIILPPVAYGAPILPPPTVDGHGALGGGLGGFLPLPITIGETGGMLREEEGGEGGGERGEEEDAQRHRFLRTRSRSRSRTRSRSPIGMIEVANAPPVFSQRLQRRRRTEGEIYPLSMATATRRQQQQQQEERRHHHHHHHHRHRHHRQEYYERERGRSRSRSPSPSPPGIVMERRNSEQLLHQQQHQHQQRRLYPSSSWHQRHSPTPFLLPTQRRHAHDDGSSPSPLRNRSRSPSRSASPTEGSRLVVRDPYPYSYRFSSSRRRSRSRSRSPIAATLVLESGPSRSSGTTTRRARGLSAIEGSVAGDPHPYHHHQQHVMVDVDVDVDDAENQLRQSPIIVHSPASDRSVSPMGGHRRRLHLQVDRYPGANDDGLMTASDSPRRRSLLPSMASSHSSFDPSLTQSLVHSEPVGAGGGRRKRRWNGSPYPFDDEHGEEDGSEVVVGGAVVAGLEEQAREHEQAMERRMEVLAIANHEDDVPPLRRQIHTTISASTDSTLPLGRDRTAAAAAVGMRGGGSGGFPLELEQRGHAGLPLRSLVGSPAAHTRSRSPLAQEIQDYAASSPSFPLREKPERRRTIGGAISDLRLLTPFRTTAAVAAADTSSMQEQQQHTTHPHPVVVVPGANNVAVATAALPVRRPSATRQVHTFDGFINPFQSQHSHPRGSPLVVEDPTTRKRPGGRHHRHLTAGYTHHHQQHNHHHPSSMASNTVEVDWDTSLTIGNPPLTPVRRHSEIAPLKSNDSPKRRDSVWSKIKNLVR